ncbi:substrate-binding domain-containing protein [Bdellovibrio sp. HCB288]|uniref:substrate-binding domain-containing protein n=1 Tax=Bdellovibrio sp. HCB288 TaxID=3394355 RepID=UPI0039B6A613
MHFNISMIFPLILCLMLPSAFAQPTTGPAAVTGKSIVFIATNMRIGGIKDVQESFAEAAEKLKWQVQVIDCAGKKNNAVKAMESAVHAKTDGIVLGGFDGADHRDLVKKAQKMGIKIVGWHAAAQPGPNQYMFVNITTEPESVAQSAAEQIAHYGAKEGGVILLTDRDYSMATAKTLALKRAVEKMRKFKVLTVVDLPLSQSDQKIMNMVKSWNQRFGSSWTHTVGINDLYFDHMARALRAVDREDIVGIGAGDGSSDAILRVTEQESPQLVTVAEPLRTQGWQLADELNRAFAGQNPSGYQTELIVVSKRNLNGLNPDNVEANIPYRQAYLKIWFPKGSVK